MFEAGVSSGQVKGGLKRPGRQWWRFLVSILGLIAFAPSAFAQGQTTYPFPHPIQVGTSSSAPLTLTLAAQAAGTNISLITVMSGQPMQVPEFVDPKFVNCAAGTALNAGATCMITVNFKPGYPGVRLGAVQINSDQGIIATALLSGVGIGGLPVLVPAQINTVAGDSQYVFQGDGGAATDTSIFLPRGLAVDAAGEVFFCDSSNNRVRFVDKQGIIHTIAGNGIAGASGDNGLAVHAELSNPSGVALDGAGNLYIADTANNVIRRVDAVSGIITTVAGRLGTSGYGGDNGPGTSALLSAPEGLALTPSGDLVIADSGNHRVRQLSIPSGQISTLAGTGVAGYRYSDDGNAAVSAQLNSPYGVAVRFDGAIAIADTANNRVRLVSTSGILTTIAGDGQGTFGGDTLPATQAQLYNPSGVAFDPAGDLFIADSENNRVRFVLAATGNTFGNIFTLVGNPGNTAVPYGDEGDANQAGLYGPSALAFDYAGNLWISDFFHNRIREVNGSLRGLTYPDMKVGKISNPIEGTLFNFGNDNLTLHIPTTSAHTLNEAALDSDPKNTTCNESAMAPSTFCLMGVEFAPTQVNTNATGSMVWLSDALNTKVVDALNGKVLSVEPSAVALVANPSPGLLGHAVTFTATVTSLASARTGTVSFTDGANDGCSAVPLAGDGTASCVVQSLSLGTHTFTAAYSGDNDNAASTSLPYTELIKQQPALALAVSTSPAVVTSTVTLTLKAVDQSGTPAGSVTFYDGSTALATVTLNSSGMAQWSTQTLGVGTHNLSAQYGGDVTNVPSTSLTVAEQITQASTVTVLASNSRNPMIGTPLILTATVVSNIGLTPTGTIQFLDGSGPGAPILGNATLGSNGTASLAVDTLAPGAHTIVAVYAGDTDDAGSNSAALPETVQATGLTLGSSNNPAVSGQNVTFSAQLSAAGPLPPTGTAIFRDNGTILASAPFNSTGLASFATSALSVGMHAITVSYAGDRYYSAAGGQLAQTVIAATTAVTLSASASPIAYGQPLGLVATVTSNGGVATGVVSFVGGGTTVGSVQLDGGGVAHLTLSSLAPGANSLVASYGGDSKAGPSASAPVVVVVKQATALAVSANSNPAPTLSAVLFTATVTNAGASPVTGTVSFAEGATAIGTAQVDGSGHATITLPQMSVGKHNIIASYSGDGANFSSVSGAFSELVQLRPTTTSVTGSADPANPQQMTLIAVVKGEGSVAPSGNVMFTSGPVTLGQASVDETGVATITVIFEKTTQPIVASYGGDLSYSASQSSSTTITAGQPAQFTLALSAPNVTLVTHQHTMLTVDLGSVKGFTDTISLGCLGLPFAGTCTFTPSQVKLSPDGTATATLILDTGDPLGAGSGTSASLPNSRMTLLCGLPLGLLLGLLRRKERNAARRTLGTLLMFALAFAVTVSATGCSGLSTSGTPPGTYSFKVVGTGQGSGITQAQTITLVVTQ